VIRNARRAPSARVTMSASVLLLAWSGTALAQAPATQPAAAPPAAAQPAATPPAAAQPSTPPAASPAPAAQRPRVGQLEEAPTSDTQSEFERRLALMLAGQGLTADEASRRAVDNSFAIEAKRREIEAVNAGVDQAKAAFWPQLLLQARYQRLSDIEQPALDFNGDGVPDPSPFPVVLNNYTLQAGVTIPLSDYVLRTMNAIDAAKHSRVSAEADEQATRLSVAREGRVTYYEWIRALGQAIVTSQAVQLAQSRYGDAQNSFNAGLSSRADVLRADAGVKQAQLLDQRARHQAVIAELRLRVLMRDPGNATYQVGENLLADLPELEQEPNADAALREALAQRPELRTLQASAASLEEQAKVTRSGNYPRLDATANYIYANPNPRYIPGDAEWNGTWDVGLVLSWTPTNIASNSASMDATRARAAGVVAQRSALEDSLRVEVADAIEGLKEARFSLGVTESGLRAAEESYRVRRELFRAGRSTLVELTDAESDLTRARIEAINARVDSRIAIVAYNYALGKDTLAARRGQQ
jgi:outer membrane protein